MFSIRRRGNVVRQAIDRFSDGAITRAMNGLLKDDLSLQLVRINPAGPGAGGIEFQDIESVLLSLTDIVIVEQRAIAALADIIPAILERKGQPNRRVGIEVALGELTLPIVAWILLANGLAGAVFGWLY